MLVYSQPWTFCRIVCELVSDRGWKLKTSQRYVWSGGYIITDPEGTTGNGSNLRMALVDYARAFVDRHKLPIRYEPSDEARNDDRSFSTSKSPWDDLDIQEMIRRAASGGPNFYSWDGFAKTRFNGFNVKYTHGT